jgi:predicted alpha/beta-fold hydrolase
MLIYIIIIIYLLYYYITLNLNTDNTDNTIYKHNLNYKINKYDCPFYLNLPLLNTIFTNAYYHYYNTKYTNQFKDLAEREIINYNNADFLIEWLPNKNEIKQNNNPIIVFSYTIVCDPIFNTYQYHFMLYLYKKHKINIIHIDFRGYTFDLHDYKSFYETGVTDTYHILNHIISHCPTHHLYLCGYSLGGVVYVNILEQNNIPNVKGVILISSPGTMDDVLQKSNNSLFKYPEKMLMSFVRSYFYLNKTAIDNPCLTRKNKRNIPNMVSFNEFFTNYIKPINNNKYKYMSDWSNDVDIIKTLIKIQTPVLIIHSHDDYIYNYTDDTLKLLDNNKNISYIITKKGGHNGFIKKNHKLFYRNHILNFIISTEKNLNI